MSTVPAWNLTLFPQELFNEVSNLLSDHNLDFIHLDSTTYTKHLTRWRSRSWFKKLLVRWDLIFRDCQLEIQHYVHASKLKPQTQRTCVSDQVRSQSQMKYHPVGDAVPFDHEVYRSHCAQHFSSCKRSDFVGIKQVVVMTDIAESIGTKVTVVTTPNTPDTFSNHVIVTYCAFFKSLDSPNLHCIGS